MASTGGLSYCERTNNISDPYGTEGCLLALPQTLVVHGERSLPPNESAFRYYDCSWSTHNSEGRYGVLHQTAVANPFVLREGSTPIVLAKAGLKLFFRARGFFSASLW